ncbi:hypothetical protein GCM10009037_01150 [Halarchaeum grantii]|uniref:Uncharacterized protein n=1 Tax=Halarchaeum grantii TaxID=1193105 RepID=A0A830ER09_9EURY|nr:hypothetical protein GCM10009037_01150 [Halarchaeum grantii]
MEFLHDGTADRVRVLALDDDPAALAVHALLHQDVPALVGSTGGLVDVLVAEVPEDVLHHVLELEPRELV